MRFEGVKIREMYFSNDVQCDYIIDEPNSPIVDQDLMQALIDIRCEQGFTPETDENLHYGFILVEWLESTSVTLHGYVADENGEHTWYDIDITSEEEEILIDKLIEKKKETYENAKQ